MKDAASTRRWAALLLGIVCLLVVLAGVGPGILKRFSVPVTRALGGADLSIGPNLGTAFIVDLSPLRLAHMADSSEFGARSRLELLEDGHPLPGHQLHDHIRNGGAGFSHWGQSLYFSSSDRTSPLTNGRRYEIRYPDTGHPALEIAARRCFHAALIVLLALALFVAAAPAQPLAVALSGRAATRTLGAALACALLAGVYETRGSYAITPDSDSYLAPPALSSRPPAYYGLITLASSPSAVRTTATALARAGLANSNQQGDVRHPIVRVVLAQQLMLVCALLLLFAVIAGLTTPIFAAALTLGVGFSGAKEPLDWVWHAPTISVVAAVLALAFFFCKKPDRVFRRLLILVLAAWLARPVIRLLFTANLVPAQLNFLMSETLAMAAHLAAAAGLVAWLVRRQSRWLLLAMGAAALAYLTRPASVFALAAVSLAAVLPFFASPRPPWSRTLLAGAMGGLLLLIPVLIKLSSRQPSAATSTLPWAIASFAVAVAEPGDSPHIADPGVQSLLVACLAARDRARVEVSAPSDLPYSPEIYRLGYYMYQIVLPISQRLAADRFPSDILAQSREQTRLLRALSRSVLPVHAPELFRIFWGSFAFMTGPQSRLSSLQPLWLTLAGAAFLAALLRDRLALAGLVLCTAHLLHLVVICMFDQPLERYVFSTEHLVVIGVALVVWSAVIRASSPRPGIPTP